MGSMMQQFERKLQYRCGSGSGSGSGSGMGSSIESNSAINRGQQAKHQEHKPSTQDLVMHGVMYC